MSFFDIMAAPFAECMILVAIHTYLGIHVLRRRVIFVDLALAQTAALGTTVGFLFGIMPETPAALIFSIVFTIIGAAIFALTRIRGERVPQEAVIGLFYAIMAAAAVLVVQKTHGAEHMDNILVGSILWVKWTDVGVAAIAYAFIGLIHYVFRKQFLLISENPEEAYTNGMNVKAWDFLFYLTFGFVISFSVRVAGVLLVFVFLVAPAIMAFMITDRLKPQLIIGWTMGTVVTVIGLMLSYGADLPSGPTVVSFYGIILVIGAIFVYFIRARNKVRSALWIGAGIVGTTALMFTVFGIGTWLSTTSLAYSGKHQHLAREMENRQQAGAVNRDAKQDLTIEKMNTWLKGSVSEERLEEYCQMDEQDSQLEYIKAVANADPKEGLPLLAYFLAKEKPAFFFREEAIGLLKQKTGTDYGYDPEFGQGKNKKALAAMHQQLCVK